MKNRLLFLGLAALMLTSCSNDDDNSTSIDSTELTKKWYYSSTVFGGTTFPYDDHEACGKDYIEFVEGGVLRDVDVWDCEEDVYLMAWDLNGNKITLSDGLDTAVGTIKKLTDSELHVQSKYDYDDDGDMETVIEKFTAQ